MYTLVHYEKEPKTNTENPEINFEELQEELALQEFQLGLFAEY